MYVLTVRSEQPFNTAFCINKLDSPFSPVTPHPPYLSPVPPNLVVISDIMVSSQLPGYGIGRGQTYDILKTANPLMFKLHCNPPDTEHGLIANHFQHNTSRLHSAPALHTGVFDDASVVNHIDNFNYPDSPWVSCTFSLPYILWEGNRRRRHPSGQDEYFVSIIRTDHPSLTDRNPKLAAEILANIIIPDRPKRVFDFARAHQEVLVAQNVPADAIVATTTWTRIVSSLESKALLDSTTMFPETRELKLRAFCWKLRICWNENGRMHPAEAANQALLWLSDGTDIEQEEETTRLLEQLAMAIYLWPHRWLIKFDFRPVRLPASVNMHQHVVQHPDY